MVINIISDVMKLPIIHRLLSSISTYGILVLVIIFQPELRKMLEQIATSKVIKYLGISQNEDEKLMKENIYKVAMAASSLAQLKVGALIVFEKDIKLKEIIDNDKEFYRMEKTSNFYLNDSLMLNYKGISHSSSTFDKNVSDLLKKIGYSYYMDWPSYGRGNTIITDMLFNIKYKISNHEDEEYFKNEKIYGKHYLLKNEKHLPLGFISDGYIKKIGDKPQSPFEIQNKILDNLTNSNEKYFKDVQVKEIKYNNLNKINESTYQRKDEKSNIELEINEIDNKNIYFYINTNYELDNPAFKIYVNDEFYDDYAGAAKNGILNINNKNKVNNIKIYFMTNERINIKEIQIKGIDQKAFETAYTKIHQSANNIKYKNETLTMDVNANKDGYLNIMIPNEYSWQIKIDGKETKQLSDSEFITVKINQGQHKIVMQYKLKGRKIGILILVLSVIALITLNVYTIKRKKK